MIKTKCITTAQQYLPEHEFVLHWMICSVSPTQLFPPANGGGLLHSLIRFLDPIPHVFVQLEYGLHKPQRPLTAMKKIALA